MTILRNQSEIPEASTADLIETYNAMTGKSIKKFSTRAAAESQVSNAILSAQDAAGHAGVKKDEVPAALTVAELAANATSSATSLNEDEKETSTMARTKSAPAKKGAAGKKPITKKAPAKKKVAASNGATRSARVVVAGAKITYKDAPEGAHRPQEGSNRTKVLTALRKRKSVTMEKLSEDVGFDCRAYVAKLAFLGWATITPPKE